MQHIAQNQLRLANDRIADRVRDASHVRLAASARPAGGRSVRRSVGHRIIRIGARLAAEPHLQPARFR